MTYTRKTDHVMSPYPRWAGKHIPLREAIRRLAIAHAFVVNNDAPHVILDADTAFVLLRALRSTRHQ